MQRRSTQPPGSGTGRASRRTTLKTLGGLALAPFVPSAAAQQIQPIRFGLQNTFTGATGVVWARQKIYEKRGLKVEAFNFADGRGVRDAMLGGKVDIGTMNLTPFFAGASTGAFVAIGIVLLGGDTVGVFARPGINSIAELKGKNVSITVGSTTGPVFVHQVGPKLGLNEGDYRVVNLQPANQVPALAAGSIDAFAGPEPYLTVAEEEKLGKVLVRFGEYDAIPTVLVVHAPFLEKYPDTVIAFLKSWLDGVEYWQSNPAGVVDSLVGMYKEGGYAGLTPAIVGKMARLPKVVPEITPQLIADMKVQAQILQKAGSLKTLPDWDKVVRPDLLAKARA